MSDTTSVYEVRKFAHTGSIGDEFEIRMPPGSSVALGQLAYQLRKKTGKNIRIWRNSSEYGRYDYGYTAYIEPPYDESTEEEKPMASIADKLTKVNESFTINMYDNGYMVEVGGRDSEDEWKTSKIICNTLKEVIDIVIQVDAMPRND